uniref:NADH dehydrogenase subunit 2 n=1 Tax=Ascaridia sp. GHL-2013 TaxID=1316655 RepID=S4UGQ1_9BILA|nr:NADH dehydrogenase subunit 2 [Ascaridia sp. GHL-2013]
MVLLMLVVLILSLLSFCSSNFFVWWGVFVLMTMVFLLVMKFSSGSGGMINYFVIQESLGLFFLIFSGSVLQFMIVMMKVGVSPLHFWVFSVVNDLSNWGLMWFLTFQKLPFFSVLVLLSCLDFVCLFVFGIVLCCLFVLVVKSYKICLFCLLLSLYIGFCYWVFFFLGVCICFFIICSNDFIDFLFYQKEMYDVGWETVLIFMNIPFGVSFFVKIFSLGSLVLSLSGFMLFLLFLMFLTTLSVGLWIVNKSMFGGLELDENHKSFCYLVVPLMVSILL